MTKGETFAGKNRGPEKPLAFRPPKRPTAVRSPGGGSGTHYLKKSPSPTGAAKTPPGVLKKFQSLQTFNTSEKIIVLVFIATYSSSNKPIFSQST